MTKFERDVRAALADGPMTSGEIARAVGVSSWMIAARLMPLARRGVLGSDLVRADAFSRVGRWHGRVKMRRWWLASSPAPPPPSPPLYQPFPWVPA